MSLVFFRRLFRRWFIEYNPLYLLSACCVLVGVSELSQGLSRSAYNTVAVTAVAELYAWALIASAAFLMRVESRRPAVMLALLVAVYQCDPTLHTETCAYLGGVGVLAGAVWLASFVAKALALASAMRVRISRSALIVLTFGALGALLFPPLLRTLGARQMSSLVALWVFTLFACGLWGSLRIESLVRLDVWGRTVLKRASRATWAILATLTLAHVWFWASELQLEYGLIIPVLLLLSTRWISRESRVWLVVVAALLSGTVMRPFFATIAGMAAITLALRAFRQPIASRAGMMGASDPVDDRPLSAVLFGLAPRAQRMRCLTGAASLLHCSAWMQRWSGGALPQHVWWLDLSLAAALLGVVWGFRAYLALVPLALSYLHLGVQAGTVSLPRTRTQWGLTEVGLGFALLATAVLTSWQFRSRRSEGESSSEEPSVDSNAGSRTDGW